MNHKHGSKSVCERKPGQVYYFQRMDLKQAPVRVFDEISSKIISNYTNSYFEVKFDDHNRVVFLKPIRSDGRASWVASYGYSDVGFLDLEVWVEDGIKRTRTFSKKGKVLSEQREPVEK